MEFTVRRDGFYMAEEEKQEEPSTKNYAASFFPNLAPPISPSSSTSAAGFLWRVGPADGGGAGGGASAGDHGRGESDNNFFAEKEHMFDKVVTPSDVGKLNRLVIPKQHAEKYFPLDPTANEKGMLLSFEDRTGKSWRFRYSYWNSSQSYVMTKGWSRFVKEKRLDAGDVVSFGRGLGEPGRDQLYIDWKRRPDNHDLPRMSRLPLAGVSMARSFGPWNGGGGRFFNIPPPPSYHQHHRQGFGGAPGGGGQFLYFGPSMAGPPQIGVQHGGGGGGGGGSGSTPMVLNSMPLVRNQATAKRVRLFGVNLDCPESDGNARFLSGASASAAWSPASPALPFLPFANGGTRAPSSPASSLSSKEQHLTLDLDL